MARFLDLPVELIEEIFKHVPRVPPRRRRTVACTHPGTLAILTRVNRYLHGITLPLIWRTADHSALRALFALLRSAGGIGAPGHRPTPRQLRFRYYASAVHFLALDKPPQTPHLAQWAGLQSLFLTSTWDPVVAGWRANKFFPNLKSVRVVLEPELDIVSFGFHFLGCLTPKLEGLDVHVVEPYDHQARGLGGDPRIMLESICSCATTTFKQLSSLSISASAWIMLPLRWEPGLAQLNGLVDFRQEASCTTVDCLTLLSRLPKLSSIQFSQLEPPAAGPSISQALWAGHRSAPFQKLQRFSARGILTYLMEFFECIPTSPLRELHIEVANPRERFGFGSSLLGGVRHPQTPDMFPRFAVILARFANTLEELDLVISETFERRDNPLSFPFSVLEGIYACSRMRSFSFRLKSGALFNFTDRDLAAMAMSWPGLRKLLLLWSLEGALGQGLTAGLVNWHALTIQGLEPFSRHCHYLEQLSIAWINTSPPAFRTVAPGRRRALYLNIIASSCENAADAASSRHVMGYLRQLWPEIVVDVEGFF